MVKTGVFTEFFFLLKYTEKHIRLRIFTNFNDREQMKKNCNIQTINRVTVNYRPIYLQNK